LMERLGRKWAICPAGLAGALGLLLLWRAETLTSFVVAALVLGTASSMSSSAPPVYVGDIAPEHLRGLAMSLHRTAGDLGLVLGPPVLGTIADRTTVQAGFGSNALLLIVATIAFAAFARETGSRRSRVRAQG